MLINGNTLNLNPHPVNTYMILIKAYLQVLMLFQYIPCPVLPRYLKLLMHITILNTRPPIPQRIKY